MLGRVRASSSSLECLEMERSSSKIIKADSLSIYEATLVKLRQGSSQCDLVSASGQAMKIDIDMNFSARVEAMTTDTNFSSSCISSSSCDYHPPGTSKEQANKTMSIIYLFSRYESSQSTISLPDEAVMTEDNFSFDGSCPGTVDR